MEMLKSKYKICNRCLESHEFPAFRAKCCDFCGYSNFTEFTFEDIDDDYWSKKKTEQIRADQASLYGNPEFSLRHYNKRLKEEQRQDQQSFYLHQQALKNPKSKASSANVPKCPTCGSTNVHPISTGKRAAGFFMAGVFSSSFGKSYECDDCKYKW